MGQETAPGCTSDTSPRGMREGYAHPFSWSVLEPLHSLASLKEKDSRTTKPARIGATMLHYPKIPGSQKAPPGRMTAFEKYDGTNLHWDWDHEFGWHDFGCRRDAFAYDERGFQLFDRAHAGLAAAITLFQAQLAEPLARILAGMNTRTAKVFTEFLGPNSFAGLHKADDPKELKLFDVELEGILLDPLAFVQNFGQLSQAARIVYRGNLTGKFCDEVRTGKYDVVEGVVCKSHKRDRQESWMVKIKTYAYMERLKAAYGDRWEEFWE